MTLTISEFNPMLKEYYSGPTPELLTYKRHAFMAMLKKTTDWGGRDAAYIIPQWYETAQAVASDFTTALANKGNGQYTRFAMGQRKRYAFAQLDRLVMKASMKNPKAFLRAYTAEVDGAFSVFGRDAAWNLYRSETGKRGTVGSEVGDTITLSNRADIVGFSVGMKVVFSLNSADPGVTAVDSFAAFTVDAIDRGLGTLTFTGQDPNADSGVVAADHIHREGDIVTAGTFIGLQGLEDHIPATAPGSGDSFQGVNRSADTDRLAGIRVDASTVTIEEGLIDAAIRLNEASKEPTHVFMNPVRLGQLIKELSGAIQRDKVKAPGKASLGFKAIRVFTPAGELPVIGDPDCPHNVAWMLDMKTWKLASTGPYPELADEDTTMLRSSTADEYEVRIAGYANLGCHDHGANARIALA